MPESTPWAFPPDLQPDDAELPFALGPVLDAVVSVRSEIPDEAITAGILGTERLGNGDVIRPDGLVLTIGYLITEAQTIWLTNNAGAAVEAHPMAYDQASGFGLVLPLRPFSVPMLARGSSAHVRVGRAEQ